MMARAAELIASGEAAFTLRAWLLAPWVEWGVAIAGLDRTLRAIQRVPAGRSGRAVDLERGQSAVRRAFRGHPWLGGRCLPRALTQYLLHRRDGTPARLVVGVKRPGAFEAHAWVEAPGTPAPPRPDRAEFAPILTAEAPGERLPR